MEKSKFNNAFENLYYWITKFGIKLYMFLLVFLRTIVVILLLITVKIFFKLKKRHSRNTFSKTSIAKKSYTLPVAYSEIISAWVYNYRVHWKLNSKNKYIKNK